MEINASLPETSMLILFLYKAPFPSTKAIPLAVYMLIFFFFFWNLEGMYTCCVWHSLFWRDIKLCSKPCFFRTVPQSYLRGCLKGYSPQFGLNKTLFYSYYRLFIISVDRCKHLGTETPITNRKLHLSPREYIQDPFTRVVSLCFFTPPKAATQPCGWWG